MRISALIKLSCVLSAVYAHGDHNDVNPDYKFIDPDNSLVDLVRQTPDTLKNFNWEIGGSTKFDEGRLILTPRPQDSSAEDDLSLIGTVWSKEPISLSPTNGFTFESTVRSVGATGNTGAGLSYWLVRDTDMSLKNFGGPTIFDGLQILFKGDSIAAFLSDGTKKSSDLNAFSTCYLAFQDSDVPVTMRLSYSPKDSFRLTLNNYLCFETDKIKFNDLDNFKIGITATSLSELSKAEQFELFKFETYNQLTGEATQANKGSLPSQPKIVTKVVTTAPSKQTPQVLQFAERERKLRDALLKSSTTKSTGSELEEKVKLVESSNIEIMNKLDHIQTLLLTANTDNTQSSGSVDNEFITKSNNQYAELRTLLKENEQYVAALVVQQSETNNLIKQMVTSLEQKIESLEEHVQKSINSMDIVSSKIGSVSNDRHFNSIIAKLNDLDSTQRTGLQTLSSHHNEPLMNLQSKIKWIMISLFLFFVLMGFSILKLRGEIKHGKIL